MLKREVREMVKYLISERKSFKVVFANDVVEVVEYKGYCWVMNGKAYSDEELVEKMVRFQNNEKKFIIKFEEVEVAEEVEENIEESLVEEVENLNDDLFQESDIAYAEEAIERETHKKEIGKMKKLLIATLTMFLIGGTTVKAETNFKPHKECFAMPVISKVENNGDYNYNVYYDTLGNKIDLTKETIYFNEKDERVYFPYDGYRFHENYHLEQELGAHINEQETVPSDITRQLVKDGEFN